MRIPGRLQAFLALPAVLASELGRRSTQKRLAPDSLIYPVSTTLPMGFSWAMFFCQDVTDHCTLAGVLVLLFLLYRDHSTPPLLGRANMAWDPLASIGRMLTIWGFWLAAQAALTFISHVSCAGVQNAGLDVHDISPCQRKCRCSRLMRCLQPTRIAVERARGYHVFVQSHGRCLCAVVISAAVDGARQWS